jgi:hypothetical protein
MQRRVEAGVRVGLVGYLDDEPVAWVSIAPRPTYLGLGGPEDFANEPERVWSLACFYRRTRLRRQGGMRQLIDAAVEHARANGAAVVEAYPVAPDSPSYRFMGFVPVFAAAGFRPFAKAGTRRTVMRLSLGEWRSAFQSILTVPSDCERAGCRCP